MSAIGDVRPPEVKAAEPATTLTALNEEAAKRPSVVPVAMDPPGSAMLGKPNTGALPLPPEAAQPMSPDNGHAVAKAMHALITVNVQTTQALVLTELKPAATQDTKQQDYRREHRSAGKRVQAVGDEEENEAGEGGATNRRRTARPDEDDAEADADGGGAADDLEAPILELLALLDSAEPLEAATVARVRRFLESGAAALVTDAPTRFRVPFRI